MKNYILIIKNILKAKNIAAKIICVLLAVLLWAYIGSTNIGEVKFKIPITFTNLPETLVMLKISNKYVSATLTGRKDNLKNVNVKSIKAVVDLDQPEIGINKSYPIELVKDEVPENIEINLSVKNVSLIVDRNVTKRVKVKANIIDKVQDGYVLGRVMIIPESINISGPESLIKSINFMQTEKLSITKATGRIIKDAGIYNNDFPDVRTDISKVRVIIPVIETSNSTEFKKKIILKNTNIDYNYIVSQEEVSVYLKSDKPDIEPSGDDVDIFIDIGSLNADELLSKGKENHIEKYYTLEAVVKRDGLKVVSIFPDMVSVKAVVK
ncbi:MAG: hypothetical protein JXN64_10725 [Spirochaetes bacterium]|nr:hypothetical protein [Spirochaetota bacterium]